MGGKKNDNYKGISVTDCTARPVTDIREVLSQRKRVSMLNAPKRNQVRLKYMSGRGRCPYLDPVVVSKAHLSRLTKLHPKHMLYLLVTNTDPGHWIHR